MHNKNSPWYYYGQKYGFPNVYWSEPITDNIIANPFNTISNIFYIITGLLCLDNYLFGMSVIILGLCSGIYHCSVIYPCQLMDISSMSLVFSVMVSQQLDLNYYNTLLMIILYQLQLFIFVKYDLPIQYNSVINIGSIIITIPEYNYNVLLTILLLLAGLQNSYFDLNYKYKYGHSLWHMYTALALYNWEKLYCFSQFYG